VGDAGKEARLKEYFLYCLCAYNNFASFCAKRPLWSLRWMMASSVEHAYFLEFRLVEVHGARGGQSNLENWQLR